MLCHLLLLALPLGCCSLPEPQNEKPVKVQGAPWAGWPGVFPGMEFTAWIRTFKQPILARDGKSYSQTVKYEWTGGASKLLEATLVRDPIHELQFAKFLEDKRTQKKTIGKHPAWLLDLKGMQDKATMPPQRQLMVRIDKDRFLILTARGPGPWEPLEQLAARFDLEKINRALEGPPRTDFRRKVEEFRQLRKGMSYAAVVEQVGKADPVSKRGNDLVYTLDDGSRILLGFPDFGKLIYVKHEIQRGQLVDLIK